MSDKIKVQIKDVPYIYLDFDMFSGTIEEVANNILGIKDKLAVAHTQREKDINSNTHRTILSITPFEDYKYVEIYPYRDYDGDSEIKIEVYRDETDEEYRNRIEANKKRSIASKAAALKRKKTNEQRERTLLKTLKKKYGE